VVTDNDFILVEHRLFTCIVYKEYYDSPI